MRYFSHNVQFDLQNRATLRVTWVKSGFCEIEPKLNMTRDRAFF